MKNKILQSLHLGGVQGADEQRSEVYMQYSERVVQSATPQFAKSANGVSGTAGQQVGAVQGL